mgnify:CR=1 FL=1
MAVFLSIPQLPLGVTIPSSIIVTVTGPGTANCGSGYHARRSDGEILTESIDASFALKHAGQISAILTDGRAAHVFAIVMRYDRASHEFTRRAPL